MPIMRRNIKRKESCSPSFGMIYRYIEIHLLEGASDTYIHIHMYLLHDITIACFSDYIRLVALEKLEHNCLSKACDFLRE